MSTRPPIATSVLVVLTLLSLSLVAGSDGTPSVRTCDQPASLSPETGFWRVMGPFVVRCQGSGPAPGGSTALLLGQKLDLKRATAHDLAAIPGLSLETAKQIVRFRLSHRGFGGLDELQEIPGIGPKTRSRLQHYLYVPKRPTL